MVAIACSLLTAGCVAPAFTPPQPAGGCPPTWQAAVLYSAEGAASEIVFVGSQRVLERRSIPYRGLSAAPTDGVKRSSDGNWWLVSNGSPAGGQSHILRFSVATCEFTNFAVEEQSVRAVVGAADGFYTTNNINGVGEIRRRNLSGAVEAEVGLSGVDFTALELHGGDLYAIGSTMGEATDRATIYRLNAQSLKSEAKIDLQGYNGTSSQAAIYGESLWVPLPTTAGDTESDDLAKVSLKDFSVSRVETHSPSPFLTASLGGVVYVGHTFMNPGFRPMSEYRFVTEVSVKGVAGDPKPLDGPILAMREQGRSLVLLSGDVREGQRLSTVSVPGVAVESVVTLPPPQEPTSYAAGLIVSGR